MELHTFADTKQFTEAVAAWLIECVAETLKKKDRFTLVLSGGNTPKALHELLSVSPYREQVQWDKLHIFWGDERAVPFDDDRNNAKMAFDTLLNHVPVPASQIHVMRTDISPEESAAEYEAILHQYFTNDLSAESFDLVLLGMGDDGHTLSLFPGTAVIHEENSWTKAYFLQQQNMYRITLTTPIVNRSSKVAFLITGAAKAKPLKEVLTGTYQPDLYPSQIIKPSSGGLYFFTDKAAASLLEN